jgi:GntR family transcriptional regulator
VTFLLDDRSGIPIYRQIIEQVKSSIARGSLGAGDQLPTVRHLAVELSINPNTVIRAYREMEIEGLLETQQGSGTFVSQKRPDIDEVERERMMDQIITEMLARATSHGFSVEDLTEALRRYQEDSP